MKRGKGTMKSIQIRLIVIIISIYCSMAFADGVGAQIVWDPWNLAQTTASATTAAQQLANQYQQLQYELNNYKNYDGNKTQWSNVQSLLQQLASVTSQGNALSYSMQNMNEAFKKKFPGYKTQKNYDTAYQDWSSTTMDTLRNTLMSAGMQANSFSTEQGTLNQLKTLSTTAQGRMQAVQVGTMIAAEQVGQMQKLRQLIISQTNAQNAYMAYHVQQEQAQQAAENNLFNNPLPYPKYGSGKGFGANDIPTLTH
jgi:P-type conjugative transfer protein TrbJ